jgi:hypothetical protein
VPSFRDRRTKLPPEAVVDEVRSRVAVPAARVIQLPARGFSNPPLTTGLPVGQVAPAVVVTVLVAVSVTAG